MSRLIRARDQVLQQIRTLSMTDSSRQIQDLVFDALVAEGLDPVHDADLESIKQIVVAVQSTRSDARAAACA